MQNETVAPASSRPTWRQGRTRQLAWIGAVVLGIAFWSGLCLLILYVA